MFGGGFNTAGFAGGGTANTGLFGAMNPPSPGTNGLFGGPTTANAFSGPTGVTAFAAANNFNAGTNSPLAAITPTHEPTSHGITYTDKVDRTPTHGKVKSFINQLADRTTTPFHYRCNDYLNPNGRSNAGAMMTNNLFGQPAAAPAQPANSGLFGATAAATNTTGMFGQSAAAPAQPAGSGLFGATAPANTSGLFGSGAGPTNLFGNATPPPAQPTGLFGQSVQPAAQPTGLFGGTGATTGGGLFGASAQPAAPTNLFGNTQQSTPGGGGLFGTQATPSVGSGLFRSTATAPAQTGPSGLFGSSPLGGTTTTLGGGGGLFGSTNTANAIPAATATGGLFGAATTPNSGGRLFGNTAANTGGGLFGNNNTTATTTNTGGGLFGTTTSTPPPTGGLFGAGRSILGGTTQTATQPTTGGLFGQQPTNTATGGGLFGASAPNTGGGLFGQGQTSAVPAATGGLFGSTTATPAPATGGLFGSSTNAATPGQTSGLFGATAAAAAAANSTGGLFGSSQTQAVPTGLFGAATNTTSPTVGGGLFGNNNTATPVTGLFGNTAQPMAAALLGNNPNAAPVFGPNFGPLAGLSAVGNVPLGLGLGPPSGGSLFGLNTPATTAAALSTPLNAPLGTTMVRDDPYNLSSIAINNAASLLYGSTQNQILPVQVPGSMSVNLTRARRRRYSPASYLNSQRTPLTIGHAPRLALTSPSSKPGDTVPQPVDPKNSGRRRKSSAHDQQFIQVESQEPLIQGTLTQWHGPQGGNQGSHFKKNESGEPVADRSLLPIARRRDYILRPSIEALSSYSESQLSRVEDFKMTREGYGSITWPGLTDLRRVNLDAAVEIDIKAVEVYGERWNKYLKDLGNTEITTPAVGESLNKRAIITLFNCCPPGWSLIKRIQWFDQQRDLLTNHTEGMEAEFVALSPDYHWTFRVEHFSRYAYPDMDVERAIRKASKKRNKNPSKPRKSVIILRKRTKSLALKTIEMQDSKGGVLSIALPRQPPLRSTVRRMLTDDLWALLQASHPSSVTDLKPYVPMGEAPFDISVLTPVLTQACNRVDPLAVGACLSEAAHTNTVFALLSSLWMNELDLLGGVITWLYKQNRQWSDSVVDLILSDQGAKAALKCFEALRKPRLSLLVASAVSPNITAQPRLAQQLVAYHNQRLHVKDPEAKAVLSLLTGALRRQNDSLRLKSWTQALAAILVFEMNATVIRANLPTFEDQIRLLRCSLDKVLLLRPDQHWISEPEWQLLCALACIHKPETQPQDDDSGSEMSDDDDLSPPESELIKEASIAFQRTETTPGAVAVWMLAVYKAYSADPEMRLVDLFQEASPWLPTTVSEESARKCNLVWTLIRFQQSRSRAFLTNEIFAEYIRATGGAELSGKPSMKPCVRVHSAPMVSSTDLGVPKPEPGEEPSYESPVLDGLTLPRWYVYMCVGEELLRKKLNLAAATAYLRAYEVEGEEVEDKMGWWAVLKDTTPKPTEGEFMTLILQALVCGNYLVDLKTMIMEAFHPGRGRMTTLLDVRLLDVLVDIRIFNLVELVYSYKYFLAMESLTGRKLKKHEEGFLTVWKEHEMDAMRDLLEKVLAAMEEIVARPGVNIKESTSEHKLSSRALRNVLTAPSETQA